MFSKIAAFFGFGLPKRISFRNTHIDHKVVSVTASKPKKPHSSTELSQTKRPNPNKNGDSEYPFATKFYQN